MFLLALLACHPWDHLPGNGYGYLDLATWDPEVVSATDGVYVRLPAAGQLARVKPDGSTTLVGLDGASPDRMILAPDDETVLVFASWPVCDDDDPEIKVVEDCREEDLHTESELAIVRNGARDHVADVPSQFNAMAFSASGSVAVAYIDQTQASAIEVDGVLNLTEAVFIDLATGETHAVPVGFAAEQVLFSDDATQAIVLSQGQVALVDLALWEVVVSYSLALDPDSEIQPENVVLIDANNTDYALVSIHGRAELYVLDLTPDAEHVDIVELDAAPSDLLVDSVTGSTLIVYAGAAQLDMVEHERFEVSSYELDEGATDMLGGDGQVLLWNQDGAARDVYLVDTTTKKIVEFRAEDTVESMLLTDDRAYAVATLGASNNGYYGLTLFDLVAQDDPVTLALQTRPVGLEIVASQTALVLLEGNDALFTVDLATAHTEDLSLEAPALGIDAMPGEDGRFVVTHDASLGLISFVDPSTGDIATAAGFASQGLLNDHPLPRRNEE